MECFLAIHTAHQFWYLFVDKSFVISVLLLISQWTTRQLMNGKTAKRMIPRRAVAYLWPSQPTGNIFLTQHSVEVVHGLIYRDNWHLPCQQTPILYCMWLAQRGPIVDSDTYQTDGTAWVTPGCWHLTDGGNVGANARRQYKSCRSYWPSSTYNKCIHFAILINAKAHVLGCFLNEIIIKILA